MKFTNAAAPQFPAQEVVYIIIDGSVNGSVAYTWFYEFPSGWLAVCPRHSLIFRKDICGIIFEVFDVPFRHKNLALWAVCMDIVRHTYTLDEA
jgi:hypothetical protein